MRLTPDQQATIRTQAADVFGADAPVRLFGSRVDDERRGGDIDLHIESTGTQEELLDKELQLYARLLKKLGDRKIDIIVQSQQSAPRAIDIEAKRTGMLL